MGQTLARAIRGALAIAGVAAASCAPPPAPDLSPHSSAIVPHVVTGLAWHQGNPGVLVALFDGVLAESADDGATWRRADVEASTGRLTALRPDLSGGAIAVGLAGSFERSRQGTWRRVPGLDPGESIWFAPGSRGRRFVTREGDLINGTGGRLRASTDGGSTWVDLSLPGGRGAYRIAAADARGATLFASLRGVRAVRLWNSQDGGRTWVDVADCQAQALNTCGVLTDPADPGTVYLVHEAVGIGGGGNLLERTTDGGRTWTRPRVPLVFLTALVPTSPATLVVQAYDTSDYRRFSLLASRDRGDTWARIGRGLPNDVQVAALAADPARPDVLFTATQAGDIFRSADGGTTWLRTSRPSSSRPSRRPPSAAR